MKSLPDSIIQIAKLKYAKYNVFASVQIAQWMDESNFGEDMPEGSNNPFGMKAVPGQPYVIAQTKEQSKDGTIDTIHAMFRRFNSIADAFDAHANLLANGKPYQSVKQYLNTDPLTYIEHMAPIYATSLIYAEALKSFVKEYNLTQYDVKPKPLPIVGIAGTVTVAAATIAPVIAKAPHIVHHFDPSNLLYTGVGVAIGFGVALGIGVIAYLEDRKKFSTVLGTVEPIQLEPPKWSIFDMAVDPRVEPAIAAIASLSQVAGDASVAEASLTEVVSSLTDVNTSLGNVSTSLGDANTSLAGVVTSMQQDATDTANAVDTAAGVPQS